MCAMPKSRKPAARKPRVAPVRALVPTRARHDGWTPERQTGFLDALAESGCVAEACAAVGMSAQSAYRLRTRVDAQGFRLAWDAALDLAIRKLSDACYSRALHGQAVPHFYKGEQVGEHRRHDNRLAMFLLRYRDPLRYAATLDQMVYSGHPEAAAIGYARARTRAADEAYGIADEPVEDGPPAYTTMPLADATAQAVEEALIAGNGPVSGSAERRGRVTDARRKRWAAEAGERERLAREGFAAASRAAREALAAGRLPDAGEWPGGDVASPSSPSAPPVRPTTPPPAAAEPAQKSPRRAPPASPRVRTP